MNEDYKKDGEKLTQVELANRIKLIIQDKGLIQRFVAEKSGFTVAIAINQYIV